jgi:SAM-dependent methyltransferase
MSVYSQPLYYEIAFSFIDVIKQVDLFEKFINQYSKTKVKRFLDIGCGPSLQLREIAKRSYEAIGLDNNPNMLTYLATKAEEDGLQITTIEADLTDFRLDQIVDFAFIMMGTISYVKSNKDLLNHLDSVAHCLKKGGLFLIENFRLDWSSEDLFIPERWVMNRNGIRVEAIYKVQLKDALEQTLIETLFLEVNDHDKNIVLKEVEETKIIFPQEFLTLVELNDNFDFLGWFERGSTKKLLRASKDNIILLRRK